MKFDKNTVIGLSLMLLIAVGFSWYSAKTKAEAAANAPQQTEQTAQQSSTPSPENTAVVATTDTAAQTQVAVLNTARYGSLDAAAMPAEETYTVLSNNKIKVKISSKGGLLHSAELLEADYKKYNSDKQVQLWDTAQSKMDIAWKNGSGAVLLSSELNFVASTSNANATDGTATVVLTATGSNNAQLQWTYSLEPNSYNVKCSFEAKGLENEMFGSPLVFRWLLNGLAQEKGIQAERSKSSIFYREMEEDRNYLSEGSGDQKRPEKELNWVAMKQDYFTAAIISAEGFDKNADLSVMVPADSQHTKSYYAELPLKTKASSNAKAEFQFYLGPNEYKALEASGAEEFTNIIDYGWWIIGYVNKYVVRPLFWFLSDYILSFGLIILIVTIIIKMVLFPITWKNFLSGAKMRVLKPEIDEINKKFEGKDPMEKQQATMALYRQTGVNPFAGCIPVLLQMPILYAMFRFFPAEIVLRGKSFLWAEDLAAYDSILNLPFNIPFYGAHVSGFTLLMAASTFVYSKMSMGSQPTMSQPGMPNMKVMMNIFSFMMIFFFNSMPSGLSLYYFTANIISIGQMWAIKKYFVNEDSIREKIEANKKKPKKKGGFAARIEEMQKAQQAKLDANKKKLRK
jgi:YidC/Oxa1 family membrane protein insertase